MMGETFWVNTKARNNMARYKFFKLSIDDDQLYFRIFQGDTLQAKSKEANFEFEIQECSNEKFV